MTLKSGCGKCGISSDTFGRGNGGNVTVIAHKDFTITGDTGISVASGEKSTGDAGTINLNIGQLTLENYSGVNSSSLGTGKGGNITIMATEGVSLFWGSQIASSVMGSGIGGNIDIKAPRLEILDIGVIQAMTTDTGNSGNIQIEADNLGVKNIGAITASTLGSGLGGNIDIASNHIEIQEGLITSVSVGKGNAGSITLTANTASLTQNTIVSTEAFDAGGGNITVNVQDNLYLANSALTAQAMGNSSLDKGGNLTISNPNIFTLDNNSELLARAYAGNGGDIRISTAQLIASPNTKIDASSQFGLNGRLLLDDMELPNFLPRYQILPETSVLLTRCPLQVDKISTFSIKSRDGLPTSPEDLRR